MIPPLAFRPEITAEQYAILGRMFVQFALIDQLVMNCVARLEGLTEEQAHTAAGKLTAGPRLDRLKIAMTKASVSAEARAAYAAFLPVWEPLKEVRDNLAHGVATVHKDTRQVAFHHWQKRRTVNAADIVSLEEVTYYAAHAVLALRYALGFEGEPIRTHPLPPAPPIPEALARYAGS